MGGNESSISGSARPSASDMYLPVVGTRMNDEKVMSQLRAASQLSRPTKCNHIVRTAFTAIWSLLVPDGPTPKPRTGEFYSTCTDLNLVITGLGVTDEDEYLNDIWVLDQNALEWRMLNITGDQISPRSSARSTIDHTTLYIFGGFNDPTYFNDLYAIDLTTGVCRLINGTGNVPSPRREAIVQFYQQKIYVWGGYDGSAKSGIHVLRPGAGGWARFERAHTGRAAAAFCQHKGRYFVFGSSKGHGLLEFHPENGDFETVECTGTEPPHQLNRAALISVDEYLFLIGGEADSQFMHIFALDVGRKWWFAFHVRPDMESISLADGNVSKNGLFMLPREYSASIHYDPNTKEIYQILESEIVSLKIAPGEVLTENSLCERFQVSRTPIRSVLQRLQENKFVEIIPHKSTTVTRINLNIATQLIYERVAIESMVFRDFVRTASPTAVEQVRDLLHRMETLAEASHHLEEFDSYAFLAADHDMHEFWFLFCGKDMLWKRIIRPHPD